jgi:phosphocarrier protein FPr
VHILAAAELVVPDEPVDLVAGGAMLDDALTRTRAQMKALIDDTTRRLGAGRPRFSRRRRIFSMTRTSSR